MTEVKPTAELSSILTQVQSLQEEREKLSKELEETRARMNKLQEGKREEMKKSLDTVIAKWLADSVENEDVRKQFTEGMDRLVNSTNETSGIWQVACQASSVHAKQLEELERLRVECTSLKERGVGRFQDEDTRKRGRSKANPSSAAGDFWDGFEISPQY